jgi:hypothetical protein
VTGSHALVILLVDACGDNALAMLRDRSSRSELESWLLRAPLSDQLSRHESLWTSLSRLVLQRRRGLIVPGEPKAGVRPQLLVRDAGTSKGLQPPVGSIAQTRFGPPCSATFSADRVGAQLPSITASAGRVTTCPASVRKARSSNILLTWPELAGGS